jgi:hypothetical protein
MSQTLHHQVLIRARSLIARPAQWTRRVLASSRTGHPVLWHDQQACQWCALGAINRAAYDLLGDRQRAEEIADEVIATCFPANMSWINDTEGHAAVLGLFDGALARSSQGCPGLPAEELETREEAAAMSAQ